MIMIHDGLYTRMLFLFIFNYAEYSIAHNTLIVDRQNIYS